MKIIGLLGGTTWVSTIEYYRLLNTKVRERLGGEHSANLLLRSIDYHEMKSRYAGRWEEIPALLRAALEDLDRRGPDCILICNNALHKAYDLVAPRMRLNAPVIHMVDAVGRAASRHSYRRLLLLGTKFTMEDGFYAKRLQGFGCEVTVPELEDRNRIQQIQSRLAAGQREEGFREYFRDLLGRHPAIDAVVLGCTELPLAFGQADTSLPLLDPIELQCAEALEFALSSS